MDRHHFGPHQIFNMDETGVSTVPNRLPKIVSQKGKKTVNKIVSGERGITTTVVCSMSAAGNFIPPVIIFRRKRMKDELMDQAPAGSLGLCRPNDSGYMNSDVFPEFLRHFQRHSHPTEERPMLLIMDNRQPRFSPLGRRSEVLFGKQHPFIDLAAAFESSHAASGQVLLWSIQKILQCSVRQLDYESSWKMCDPVSSQLSHLVGIWEDGHSGYRDESLRMHWDLSAQSPGV